MPYATNPDDGVRIYYKDIGDGPPLIVHHGTAGDHRSWHRLFGHPVDYAEKLSKHFRLLLLDARGKGRSDKPHEKTAYTMPRLVSDVEAVIDQAGCESAHFMGYSMGGRVAFGIGCYGPLERFRSLIIGAGSYRNPRDFPVPEEILQILETRTMTDYIAAQERRSGHAMPDDQREDLLSLEPRAYLAYIRQTLREPDMEASLDRMALPVLLFAGENDQITGQDIPGMGRRAAAQLPNARFLLIPGEGHVSAFFRTDLIIPEIVKFIELVETERN